MARYRRAGPADNHFNLRTATIDGLAGAGNARVIVHMCANWIIVASISLIASGAV
jgi:hypothetical protein